MTLLTIDSTVFKHTVLLNRDGNNEIPNNIPAPHIGARMFEYQFPSYTSFLSFPFSILGHQNLFSKACISKVLLSQFLVEKQSLVS